VVFAFVPPTSFLGGWGTFIVSLAFIGLSTAAVSEFASNFGCVLGLPDVVTAISIVALGTSLPDTFASRVAIVKDDFADNAIGNVTGSNSVNVFLGLGMPWVIGAFYHQYASSGAGVYIVPAAGLAFSVVVFTVFAVVAISMLMFRRFVLGGEAGGNKPVAYGFSFVFVFLWLLYLLLSSLYATGQLPGVTL
jgi:solute carrier family 8 (sodium/calcium exchanger)